MTAAEDAYDVYRLHRVTVRDDAGHLILDGLATLALLDALSNLADDLEMRFVGPPEPADAPREEEAPCPTPR